MTPLPLEELIERCPSIYKLVVIAAKRAKELSEGAQKLVETDLKKITGIALEEIRQGKIVYQADEIEKAKGERPTGKAKERATAGAKKKK